MYQCEWTHLPHDPAQVSSQLLRLLGSNDAPSPLQVVAASGDPDFSVLYTKTAFATTILAQRAEKLCEGIYRAILAWATRGRTHCSDVGPFCRQLEGGTLSKKSQQAAVKLAIGGLGFTALGLYLGLHALIWRIWIVISGLWVIGLITLALFAADKKAGAAPLLEPAFWAVILVPPLLLYLAVRVLAWIVSAVRPRD